MPDPTPDPIARNAARPTEKTAERAWGDPGLTWGDPAMFAEALAVADPVVQSAYERQARRVAELEREVDGLRRRLRAPAMIRVRPVEGHVCTALGTDEPIESERDVPDVQHYRDAIDRGDLVLAERRADPVERFLGELARLDSPDRTVRGEAALPDKLRRLRQALDRRTVRHAAQVAELERQLAASEALVVQLRGATG